jgi:hypothetical protein
MNEAYNKLKKRFNENPIEMILITAIAATAAAKLIDSVSAAQGRRAYAKSVNYRVNQIR